MAKGGSSSGGSGGQTGSSGPYSWGGSSTGGTTGTFAPNLGFGDTFDAKAFGTQIAGDASVAYGQGPKINPISGFTPYSQETQGLIGQGLQNNEDMRSGTIGDVASGGWLDGANPYFENNLQRTRDNISQDVNSTFNYNGLFGADLHAKGLSEGLANAENDARMANFENEYGRMVGARGMLDQGTATAAGYSGLLDSKAKEKAAADSMMWDRNNDSEYQHIAKYLNMLTGGKSGIAGNTNQPLTFWDMLGSAGTFLGNIL